MLTTRLHRRLVPPSTSSPLIPLLNLQQIPPWDYRPPISRISPFLPPSNASRTQPQSPMGSPTSNLNHYFFVFVFLFFFLFSLSCPISCDQTLDRPESSRPSGYRVFHVKNARPLYLINRRREVVLDGARRRTERMMIKRKINKKVTGGDDSRSTRPFAVMLPKGFVPPSGSSPACHNENPNSAVTSYCELSNPKP